MVKDLHERYDVFCSFVVVVTKRLSHRMGPDIIAVNHTCCFGECSIGLRGRDWAVSLSGLKKILMGSHAGCITDDLTLQGQDGKPFLLAGLLFDD